MHLTRPKSIVFILSLLLISTGCKKDNDSNPGAANSDYYVKFTVDGSDQLFTNNAEGNMNVNTVGGNFIFTGAALKVLFTATSNNLTLSISSVTQLKTNINYVNFVTTTAGNEKSTIASISYIDPAAIQFTTWGDEFKSLGIISDTKITFSEITTTNLKGSFSGTAYKSISGTAEKRILKGDFNLKRK